MTPKTAISVALSSHVCFR